jgi:hypothetical protein
MSFKIYDRFTNFCAQFRNLGRQVLLNVQKIRHLGGLVFHVKISREQRHLKKWAFRHF